MTSENLRGGKAGLTSVRLSRDIAVVFIVSKYMFL